MLGLGRKTGSGGKGGEAADSREWRATGGIGLGGDEDGRKCSGEKLWVERREAEVWVSLRAEKRWTAWGGTTNGNRQRTWEETWIAGDAVKDL